MAQHLHAGADMLAGTALQSMARRLEAARSHGAQEPSKLVSARDWQGKVLQKIEPGKAAEKLALRQIASHVAMGPPPACMLQTTVLEQHLAAHVEQQQQQHELERHSPAPQRQNGQTTEGSSVGHRAGYDSHRSGTTSPTTVVRRRWLVLVEEVRVNAQLLERQRREDAVYRLQHWARVSSMRRQWHRVVDEARARRKLHVLMRQQRIFEAVRRGAAAVAIQKRYRGSIGRWIARARRQGDERAYLDLVSRRDQMLRAQRERLQRRHEAAAHKLQAWHRGKQLRDRFRHQVVCIIRIQRFIRHLRVRRKWAELLQQLSAYAQLMGRREAVLRRSRLSAEKAGEGRSEAATIRLQRFIRHTLALRKWHRLLPQGTLHAQMVARRDAISRRFRTAAHAQGQQDHRLFACVEAAHMLQRFWQKRRLRKLWIELMFDLRVHTELVDRRRQSDAIFKLQQWVRRNSMRRQWYRLLEMAKRKFAVVSGLAQSRKDLAMSYLRSWFHGRILRGRWLVLVEEVRVNAQLLERQRREDAVYRLQHWARVSSMRRQWHRVVDEARARRKLHVLMRQQRIFEAVRRGAAAVAIQKRYRGSIGRWIARARRQGDERAYLDLVSRRDQMLRAQRERLQRRHEAAAHKLQAWHRGKQLRDRFRHQVVCIIRIQRFIRHLRVRRKWAELLQQLSAYAQLMGRREAVLRRFRAASGHLLAQTEAAVLTQRSIHQQKLRGSWRQLVADAGALQTLNRAMAAKKLQRWCRARFLMRRWQIMLANVRLFTVFSEREREAVLRLQSCARGRQGRRLKEELRHCAMVARQHESAVHSSTVRWTRVAMVAPVGIQGNEAACVPLDRRPLSNEYTAGHRMIRWWRSIILRRRWKSLIGDLRINGNLHRRRQQTEAVHRLQRWLRRTLLRRQLYRVVDGAEVRRKLRTLMRDQRVIEAKTRAAPTGMAERQPCDRRSLSCVAVDGCRVRVEQVPQTRASDMTVSESDKMQVGSCWVTAAAAACRVGEQSGLLVSNQTESTAVRVDIFEEGPPEQPSPAIGTQSYEDSLREVAQDCEDTRMFGPSELTRIAIGLSRNASVPSRASRFGFCEFGLFVSCSELRELHMEAASLRSLHVHELSMGSELSGQSSTSRNILVFDAPPEACRPGRVLESASGRRSAMLRQEMRGLIIDRESRAVLSRPLHHFWALGEWPEMAPVEESALLHADRPLLLLEHLQGEMVHLWELDGRLHAATRAGRSPVALDVEAFLEGHRIDYAGFAHCSIGAGLTPVFVWLECSAVASNPGSVSKPELILIALRHISSGLYAPRSDLKHAARHFRIPVIAQLATWSPTPNTLLTVATAELRELATHSLADGSHRALPAAPDAVRIADGAVIIHDEVSGFFAKLDLLHSGAKVAPCTASGSFDAQQRRCDATKSLLLPVVTGMFRARSVDRPFAGEPVHIVR